MARETKAQQTERLEATRELRELFETSSTDEREVRAHRTVHCILRSVSRSGMSRTLTLFVVRNGEMHYITHKVALALGWKCNKEGNLKVDGCGMDMGFHAVYNLSGALFGHADRGGYTLTHRWV